jgi:hypothetical protein
LVLADENRAPSFCFDAFYSRAAALARTGTKVQPCRQEKSQGTPMDQPLKSGGFNNPSKLKPVFYRSPFNRLANLYPPYGAKIARLQKMLRFMS